MTLLAVTWFVDLIWMIYWIPHWGSDELKDQQKGLHNFVIFVSIINFILKLAVIAMVSLTNRDMLRKQLLDI